MDEQAPNPTPPGDANVPADADLVAKTLAGDRKAFDVLILRYQRQSVAVSYRLLGNTNDALEVTQDAYLKAFKGLSTLQKPGAFAGWLMRIVSNLSLNYRRSRKTRQQLSLDETLGSDENAHGSALGLGIASDNPLRTLQSREMGAKLQQALQQLPEKQRNAILMFTIEEMPQKEVAEALGCSVEAVKWHVFQGRKKLREMLKDVI